MSLSELQGSVDSFPAWKTILWCFYPMATLVILELLVRLINDDDDQDGGKMVTVMQSAQ